MQTFLYRQLAMKRRLKSRSERILVTASGREAEVWMTEDGREKRKRWMTQQGRTKPCAAQGKLWVDLPSNGKHRGRRSRKQGSYQVHRRYDWWLLVSVSWNTRDTCRCFICLSELVTSVSRYYVVSTNFKQ